jgi:HK97 gp10 family phage protein
MKITVDVQGLHGVEDALSQAGPKLAKRVLRKALLAGGQKMVDAAKRRAPILAKASPNRRPGELRDAIAMTVKLSTKQEAGTAKIGLKRDKARGQQSPSVWGSFVEFGTAHSAAQPYMRPGFDHAKKDALETFTAVIRTGVDTLDK